MTAQALESLLSERTERLWARPASPAEVGQEPDETAIFAAVGQALSLWEAVETAQARLFLKLSEVAPASMRVVQRTYGTIGFNVGRRDAVRFAAELYFGIHWNRAKRDLDKLLSHIGSASHRRDDIAHGQVIGLIIGTIDGRPAPPMSYRLVPPDYNSRFNFATIAAARETDPSQIHPGKYNYTTATIDVVAAKFRFLRYAIYGYMDQFDKEEDGAFTEKSLQRLIKSRK